MKRAPTKIALLEHTGGGNLGDDATVDVVIRNIRQRWPDAVIALFSMNPGDTAKRYGIPSYPIKRYTWTLGYKSATTEANRASNFEFRRWLRTTRTPAIRLPRAVLLELAFLVASLRIIWPFDFLILSGGGQFTERSGPWGFPYAILTWFVMAKSARIKCIVLNVGAGPLTQPLSKFFVTRALFAADYVSFRDEQSQALARDIGFTGESHVFPDNVYSLEVPSPSIGCSGRRDQPIVGIAPMPYPADPPFNAAEKKAIYEDLIARLAMFSSSLVRRSYSLALFGTDVGADPGPIEDLRTILRNRHNIATSPYDPVKTVHELLSTMSAMDYVVTSRFHGVVFAHLLNKPVLALSPHPKVANLMNALGLSKYCVDIRTFDPNLLADTFASLVRDSDNVKSRMAATLASYKSLLKVQFDDLWPRNVKQS